MSIKSPVIPSLDRHLGVPPPIFLSDHDRSKWSTKSWQEARSNPTAERRCHSRTSGTSGFGTDQDVLARSKSDTEGSVSDDGTFGYWLLEIQVFSQLNSRV